MFFFQSKIFFFILLYSLLFCSLVKANPKNLSISKKIVKASKRIYLQDYPGAYNPSIIEFGENYLLTFRYPPDRVSEPWLSYIGVVLLDDFFEPISNVGILDTRLTRKKTPSQSEDARIFSFEGRYFLIYNDNMETTFPSIWDRRDMYIAELFFFENQFFLSEPLRLTHESKFTHIRWQKNWSPFIWSGNILLSYSINPHEILIPSFSSGICRPCYETLKSLYWNFGSLRGGTPAQLVGNEYLAFFHSGTLTTTPCSNNKELWHYFMGAYTFSKDPPFELKKISPFPIDAPGFYTYSSYEKRVIYPGGFVVSGDNLFLAYGKDDCEIWIATIDLQELKNSLVEIK